MKKSIAILLLLTMLLGVAGLTGCVSSNDGEVNFIVPETGFDTETPVTITFGHTMGDNLQKILEKAIERFQEAYPNITVNHEYKGSWSTINETINTEIYGNNQPNIVFCYPDHVAMYNLAKAVVTLDDLIDSQIAIGSDGAIIGLTDAQKSDIVSSYYDEGKVFGDGLMYTMPLSKSTEILYYDKTAFDENGWEVPTTWEEMWALCAKIKEKYPNDYPLGYDSEANWFITLCEQYKTGFTDLEGDELFIFDNDENKALMKELRDYYEKGYFNTQELYGSYTSNMFKEQKEGQKRCYMCIGSSGGAQYQVPKIEDDNGQLIGYAFEVGVAAIPQYDQNNKKAISQGPSVCILKGSNTTDQEIIASWLFVKFLMTDVQFQAEYSMQSGYMPVINSVLENEVYAEWLEEAKNATGMEAVNEKLQARVVALGIEGRDSYYISPAFVGSTTARNEVGYLLTECISAQPSGNQTVDDVINKAFADAMEECRYQAS